MNKWQRKEWRRVKVALGLKSKCDECWENILELCKELKAVRGE